MIHPIQSINLSSGFGIFGAVLLFPVISVTAQQTNQNQQSVTVAPGDKKTVGFAAENPGDTYQLDITPGGGKKFKTTGTDNILGENSDGFLWQRVTNTEQLKRFKVTSANIHQGHEALFNLEFKKDGGGGGGGGGPLADAYVKAVNCFVKIYKPGTISAPGALIPAPTQVGKPYTGILQRNTDDEIATGVEDCTSGSKTGTGLTADNDLVKMELSWNPTTLRPDMVNGKTLTLTLPPGAIAYRDDGTQLTQFSVTIGSGGSDQLSQLASARKQNIFLEGNGPWNGGDVILKVDGLDHLGAQGKAKLVPVIFVTPAGDPVKSPVDQAIGQNEFTYDVQSPGVLTVTLKATVQNYDNLPDDIKNGLVFDFKKDANNQIIGTSSFAWKQPENQGGKPAVSGSELTATGIFTTLPDRNDAFGKKWAQIKLGGIEIAKEDFEVFFPIKDSAGAFVSNHSGGQMDVWDRITRKLNPGTVPNWYYYWRQIPEANGVNLAYGGTGINGKVPAITDWGYGRQIDKTLVLIGEDGYSAGNAYGVGRFASGIDQFGDTLIHEGRHIWQIAEFDKLVPTGTANTPWEIGWAFNQGSNHNHWTLGTDGKPGKAGVDDDSDGNVDNLFSSGPGELGKFDPATALADRDQNLTHPNLVIQTWQNWPAAIPYPNPMTHATWEIESDAINHADANYAEHQNARRDWGNPGKNHQEIDKWDD